MAYERPLFLHLADHDSKRLTRKPCLVIQYGHLEAQFFIARDPPLKASAINRPMHET